MSNVLRLNAALQASVAGQSHLNLFTARIGNHKGCPYSVRGQGSRVRKRRLWYIGLGVGLGCDGTHARVLKLENLFQGYCAPFWYIGLGSGLGCGGTHTRVLKLEFLFQGNCGPFWYIGPGRRVRDLGRDGIPPRVMVTGGHPRWEGRGVSSPIQDAIALASVDYACRLRLGMITYPQTPDFRMEC